MIKQRSLILAMIAAIALVFATVPMNVQAVTEDDGEFVANPYCDKVKSGESEATGVCHDRRDNSETTGLYLCNTGVWEEEWKDCEDATEDE